MYAVSPGRYVRVVCLPPSLSTPSRSTSLGRNLEPPGVKARAISSGFNVAFSLSGSLSFTCHASSVLYGSPFPDNWKGTTVLCSDVEMRGILLNNAVSHVRSKTKVSFRIGAKEYSASSKIGTKHTSSYFAFCLFLAVCWRATYTEPWHLKPGLPCLSLRERITPRTSKKSPGYRWNLATKFTFRRVSEPFQQMSRWCAREGEKVPSHQSRSFLMASVGYLLRDVNRKTNSGKLTDRN